MTTSIPVGEERILPVEDDEFATSRMKSAKERDPRLDDTSPRSPSSPSSPPPPPSSPRATEAGGDEVDEAAQILLQVRRNGGDEDDGVTSTEQRQQGLGLRGAGRGRGGDVTGGKGGGRVGGQRRGRGRGGGGGGGDTVEETNMIETWVYTQSFERGR